MTKRTISTFEIDCQKGFTPLCPNELPVPEGDQIVDELNRMATLADIRVGSKDCHNRHAIWISTKDKPQFTPIEGEENCDMVWDAHCICGEKGFELLDGLPQPHEYNYFVWKGMENNVHPYGACYHDLTEMRSTGVIEFFILGGIDTVIVGGLATDYCVVTTVNQLVEAGLDVILYLPACRGIDPTTTANAIKAMEEKNVLIADTFDELKALVG